MDCVFCKIINGEIPSKKVYDDDKIMAFYDLEPKAPVHLLIIPKQHIEGASFVNEENCDIVGYIFSKIPQIASSMKINDYRIINNCGKDAGQTVFHLHFHLLGGKKLSNDFA